MTYTESTSVFLDDGEPQDISEDLWVQVLQEAGSFASGPLWDPFPLAERPAIARQLYQLVTAARQRASYWLAKPFEEHSAGMNENSVLWRGLTRSWGNATSVRHPDVTEWTMYFDDFRGRSYVRYKDVIDSMKDALFRIVDPDFVYVKEGRRTVREVAERFVGIGPNTENYIAGLVRRMNEYRALDGNTPMELTETIMQRIAERGVEIHDIRGQMKRHDAKSPETRPADAWRYTAVHHTGVSRGVRSLQGDIDSWRGHSIHHVVNNGWPTIAYFLGFSQSGRAFLLRDIHEVGYHAWAGANYQTVATCGDLHITNTPTAELLAALEVGLDVLHEAAELPNLIGHTGTYGHQELTFLDPRNSTACPGQLLPWVQHYRNHVGPQNDPNARYFEATGHWVVNTPDAPMLKLWTDLGGVATEGYPLAGMTQRPSGVYEQIFENSLLEIYADRKGRRGGLGQRYMALLSQMGRVQLAVADSGDGVE